MNTDPIADMLTRIRNGYMAKKLSVSVPYSSVKERIADVLKRYDYLDTVSVEGEGKNKSLEIELAYNEDGEPRLNHIRRASRPSLRKYIKAKEVGLVRGGFGIAIISTSKGMMSDQEAREAGLGGELVAKVW